MPREGHLSITVTLCHWQNNDLILDCTRSNYPKLTAYDWRKDLACWRASMGATASHGGEGALQALPLGLRSRAFSHGDEDWYDDSRLSKPHYPYFIIYFFFKASFTWKYSSLKTIAMIYVANMSTETLVYARTQVPREDTLRYKIRPCLHLSCVRLPNHSIPNE